MFFSQCAFCEKKYNSRQNYYLHVNKSHRELLAQNWFVHFSDGTIKSFKYTTNLAQAAQLRLILILFVP